MEIDSSSDDDLNIHSSSPATQQEPPATSSIPLTTSISPADRISELNDIDLSVSRLLQAASTATSILANNTTNNNNTVTNLSTSQQSFVTATQSYFSTLSSIEVRLRRQIYALEEAGLIAPGDERDTRRGRTLNVESQQQPQQGGQTDATSSSRDIGGGGALDPSWLNARVSDTVEMSKKREVLAQAKAAIMELRDEQQMRQMRQQRSTGNQDADMSDQNDD